MRAWRLRNRAASASPLLFLAILHLAISRRSAIVMFASLMLTKQAVDAALLNEAGAAPGERRGSSRRPAPRRRKRTCFLQRRRRGRPNGDVSSAPMTTIAGRWAPRPLILA
jgi:hypothetical protein